MGPFQAQRLKLAKPPLIALAAGGDALARPFRLGRNPAVHLVKDDSFLGENPFRPAIELSEITVSAAKLALVKPDNAGTKVAKKGAIVTDHQKCATMLAQHIFHPLDGRHVHMVGRLIEKQHVRLGIERAGQRHAPRLATGQPVAHPVGVEPEPHQEFLGLVDRDRPSQPVGVMTGDNDASQGHAGWQLRGLWQIGDTGSRGHPQAALIHVGAPCHQLHQTGLAGTVPSDQRQPVTGMKRHIGMAKEPAVTKIDAGIGNGQQRCRHVSSQPSRGSAPCCQRQH